VLDLPTEARFTVTATVARQRVEGVKAAVVYSTVIKRYAGS